MRTISVILVSVLLVVVAEAQPVQWEPTAGPPSARAPQFEIAPSGALFIAQAGRIARSTDEGATWQHLDVSRCVEQFRMEDSALLLKTCDGWYRSKDDGQTWSEHEPVRLGPDEEPVRQIVRSNELGSFATTGQKVYHSDDGSEWRDVSSYPDDAYGYVSVSLLHASHELDSVYAAVTSESDFGPSTVLYSWQPDSSAWRRVDGVGGSLQVLFAVGNDIYLGSEGQSLYWSGSLTRWRNGSRAEELYSGDVLSASLRADTVFIGTPQGVKYSTDAGDEWRSIGPGRTLAVAKLAWHDDLLFAVTGMYAPWMLDPHGAMFNVGVGVLRRDAEDWTRLDPGLAAGDIAALVSYGDSLFALSDNGVWTTSDGGAAWQAYDSTGWQYPMPFELMGLYEGELHRTAWGDLLLDGAGTVLHLTSHEPDSERRGAWAPLSERKARSLQVMRDRFLYAILDDDCLYRSANRRATWERVAQAACPITLLEEGGDTLWAATPDGELLRRGVPFTALPPSSWDTLGVIGGGEAISSLYALSGGYVFAESARVLHRSDDWGRTWTPLPDAPLPAGQLLTNHEGQIFLHDGQYLWGSANRGASWQNITANLPDDVRIQAMVMDSVGRMYVGLSGHGVWRSAQPVVLEAESATEVPRPSILSAPFPNPARDRITLTYTLAQPARVQLRVYDVLGRHVAAIVEGRRPAGAHTAHWVLDGVPAGIYFVRLAAEEESYTRPATVVR